MKLKNLLIIILCLSTFQFGIAQPNLIKPELKHYIQTRVDNGVNPSVAMAYIDNDSVEYYNYGKTKLAAGVEVNNVTVYEIGSISKVFTCIILADEVIKGTMNLDDPVAKFLPDSVKIPSRNGRQITLKDLATHTSALPRMPFNLNPSDSANPFADYTVGKLYEFLSTYELTRDIGVQYEYSNLGMGLLGHVLELHTGKSYEDLVMDRIAKPLGMEDTKIELTDSMRERLALPHNNEVKETKNWDIPVLGGAGALRSTTRDMVKFVKANITPNASRLYKAMALSHQVAFKNEANNFQIGLGWHFANNNNIIWHNGGTGGYRAFAGFIQGGRQGVVVLTNSIYSVDRVGLVQLGQNLDLKIPEKPKFPEIVEVEDSVLESYVGKYQLFPAVFVTVSKKGSQLFGQLTGQPEFEIYPSANNVFFLKIVEASITFNKNEDGLVDGLTLKQNGQNMVGTKVD
ncbi:serine hydrolase [Winogradskyella aurantia]|uniref:Beta-lactamase n=1 Tax=Winogradskyella aurantia TaxID=1915063 RepID=A0A265UTQ1_9FLAO|nr:serine hydrolase [Winogradskyella aurantia]OZV68676.1 hypothetical protein CA834_09440 [Winogradskyella aurantia]